MIQELATKMGLFFFYEGKNKVSQAFSLVVGEFLKKYNWKLAAISCDGILIAGFESNEFNNGIVEKLKIEHFPALFIVDPKQQIVIPIAFGLSSLDQIEANIEMQLKNRIKG